MKTGFIVVLLAVMSAFAADSADPPVVSTASASPTTSPVMTTASTTPTTKTSPTTPTTPGTTTNVTTPSNITGTTVNGTTDNSTTTTAPPTTKPTTPPPTTPTPTPSTTGTWTVKGADNKTCIKMAFTGSVKMNNNKDVIAIPTTADSSGSSCKGDASDFQLVFADPTDVEYTVTLSFLMQDGKSYMWNAAVNTNETSGSQVQVRFDTPAGQSFQCDEQTIPVGKTFNLTLADMRIQPFASYAGNDFGDIYPCVVPSGPNAALIVGLVLGSIIVILLVALIVLFMKKKSPGRGYNNFS